MAIIHFNIHDIVHVKVETRSHGIITQVSHQLSEFRDDEKNSVPPDLLILDYERLPKFKKPVVISEYYIYEGGWLNIPCHRTCFNLITNPITIYCDKFILPVNLLVHLALLKKGASLMHAAGAELNGMRYLFPAFGGIGKTILVASIVFSGGKLFGDDMVIINKDGILSYPIDFSVYNYHMKILAINDNRAKFKFWVTDSLNLITNCLERNDNILFKAMRVFLNTLKTSYINVPPRTIFGHEYIAQNGKIDGIFYLERRDVQSSSVEHNPIASDIIASCATNILFHEWHQSMQFLFAYSALSSFSLEDIFQRTKAIFENLFSKQTCYLIDIPQSMSSEDYQKELLRYLVNV